MTNDVPTVCYTSPTDPRARPLVDDLAREYDQRYGLNDGIPSSAELSRYPAELFQPAHGGTFLLLLHGGQAVAGGAFMRVDDPNEHANPPSESGGAGTVEIKRVWTHAAHRRRGYARLVMAELEAEAARRGVHTVTLTTGARQPEAVALYLSLGYTPLFDLDGDYEEISYLTFTKSI